MLKQIFTYATIQNAFEMSLFCSKLHLFDQKYSKKYEILLECKSDVFYVNMCSNIIYFCVFSASLLQSSVSHDLQKS